jgi:hypothetical protein
LIFLYLNITYAHVCGIYLRIELSVIIAQKLGPEYVEAYFTLNSSVYIRSQTYIINQEFKKHMYLVSRWFKIFATVCSRPVPPWKMFHKRKVLRCLRELSSGVKRAGHKANISFFYLVPSSRTSELYLHSPIHLHGVVLN